MFALCRLDWTVLGQWLLGEGWNGLEKQTGWHGKTNRNGYGQPKPAPMFGDKHQGAEKNGKKTLVRFHFSQNPFV